MKNIEYYLNKPANQTDAEHLSLMEPEIGGGRISRETIDTIRNSPQCTEISISGLTQDTFEYFVANYARQFKAIIFWKCPLVSDLVALESLRDIHYIVYFWNQRVTKLWDLSKNPNLKGLAFDDFTRMHSLHDIPRSKSLKELQFGDRVWRKYVLESLSPLVNCKSLERLAFAPKKIIDHDIRPLAKMTWLKQLEFPYHLFKTEEVAWLTAHLPRTVESRSLRATHLIKYPPEYQGQLKDTIVIGKGKPSLDSKLDAAAIAKHTRRFDELVQKFTSNPKLSPTS